MTGKKKKKNLYILYSIYIYVTSNKGHDIPVGDDKVIYVLLVLHSR